MATQRSVNNTRHNKLESSTANYKQTENLLKSTIQINQQLYWQTQKSSTIIVERYTNGNWL